MQPEASARYFYGWFILPIATLGLMCTSPGQSFGVSVFRPFMEEQLGVTAVNFSWAYAVATIVGALPLIFIGALMDRYGPRRLMIVVVLLLSCGCLFISQASGLITLAIGLTMLRMFGQASLGMLSTSTVSLWFSRRLGFANGIMFTGLAMAIAVVPTFSLILIENLGWRWAYIALGAIVAAVMLPLLALFYRNRPEDIGQGLDGDAVIEHAEAEMTGMDDLGDENSTVSRAAASGVPVSWTLKQAMSTRAFYIAATCTGSFALSVTAFTMCIGVIFLSQGYSETQASEASAAMLGALGLIFMFTQIPAGRLADIIPLNLLLAVSMVVMAVPAVLLIFSDSFAYLWIIGGAMGLSQACLGASTGKLWATYYGRDHIGKIKSVVSKFLIVASAMGPVIMDVGHQQLGSYDTILWLFVLLPMPLAIAAVFATKPRLA